MKKIILTILLMDLCSLCSIRIAAQDINGHDPWTIMQKNDVIAAFGNPDEYDLSTSESGNIEYYYYNSVNPEKTDVLKFSENGRLEVYSLHTNRFAVLTKKIPGGVRVGDPLSKVQAAFKVSYRKDLDEYYINVDNNESPLFFKIENGIIVLMYYVEWV